MARMTGGTSYEENRLADYSDDSSIYRGSMDLPFMLLTILLLGIGVIMVLSASFARAYYDPSHETGGNAVYYFMRQMIFAVGGVGVMLIFSKFPMALYRRLSTYILIGTIVLMAAVPVIGTEVNGARRWIDLGFTTFQPSEIAKISIVITFSAMICKYKEKMATVRYGVAPFFALLAVFVGLLFLQRHLSASIIIIAIGVAMMFIGGVKLYWFIGGIAAVGAVGGLAVLLLEHVRARITTWLNPLEDITGDGWQIVQSLYAVGSGGVLGLGLGQSRQKYLYLPEEHNDFIFSVVCEELGFIGATLILALFALLIIRGYWLAMHARDRYSFLVCTGITTMFAIQIILNVAVVTSLVPATGISLPLFSYGGTALLIQMAAIGMILSVSRDIPAKKQL